MSLSRSFTIFIYFHGKYHGKYHHHHYPTACVSRNSAPEEVALRPRDKAHAAGGHWDHGEILRQPGLSKDIIIVCLVFVECCLLMFIALLDTI